MEEKEKNLTFVDEHLRRKALGKRLFGLMLIAAGVLWGVQTYGIEIPEWLLTWQSLVICLGIIGAATHRFRAGGWFIPILVGLFFMLDEYSDIENIRDYLIPGALVIIGSLIFFVRPKQRWGNGMNSCGGRRKFDVSVTSDDSHLNVDAVFGSVQKTVVNKDFKGGTINCRFGGCEVNLLHSDIQGTIEIDLYCKLGGCKLMIPSNWLVKSEVTVTMGSVEDNRITAGDPDPDKILILKGAVMMGGIEITSH